MPETPLRIGLLQCGHVHPEVAADLGDYPELFAELLAPHGIELTTFDVDHDQFPTDLEAFDGWVISGSANSAYDDLPWIHRTEDLLRQMITDEIPMVAVCFGHQLLAQAMGSTVAKAADGWGAGVHAYEFLGEPEPWMVPPPSAPVRVIASHQDQVTALPDGAVLLARTDHCPIAAFTLGPTAFAIQPHPEFTAAVSRGLVERRRDRIGAEASDAALASLDQPLDRDLVGGWMAAFLRQAAAVARARP
ncbi:type 1 glutamine amidotransferase [Aquihabitans sp. McL0605]|uniref:type 1 glutamine amidotransferase n=1 Tax=Aquihabitans sp. McL0605 TaxID=3415671 RepID=UPI003CFB32E4